MSYVTDTHAIIWYMIDDPNLSSTARKAFEEVDSGQDQIFIPCIIFYELLYLIEKKKLDINFDSLIATVSSSANYRVEPLCLPIIEGSRAITREETPDPWDRLIIATSLHLGVPLITRDRAMQRTAQKAGVEVIW